MKKTVDMVFGKYEWICPECGESYTESEHLSEVKCECGKSFYTSYPEHCFG